jgi:SHS2 domain-containing protein
VYRWVDHTAEVELAIEAGGEREVFAEALSALAELLGVDDRARGDAGAGGADDAGARDRAGGGSGDRAGGGGNGDGADGREDQRREVCAQAPDRPALLAAWLEELVFLAETEGFVATRIVDLALTADRVDATVAGFVGNPPPLVKAITYHRLRFDRHGSGYIAGVVLDV